MRRPSPRGCAAIAGGLLAAVGLGAGWATTSGDGGGDLAATPAPVAIAALVDPGPPLPAGLATAARGLPGVDAVAIAAGRVLLESDGLVLAAVPTAGGNLCLLVDDPASGLAAGCGATLTVERPAVALAVRRGGDLLLAGVARDGATSVEARTASAGLCAAGVERNAFACVAPGAAPADVASFVVTDAAGTTAFSAATIPAAPTAPPLDSEPAPGGVPERGPNLLPANATAKQRSATWRRLDRELDLVVLRPTATNGVPLRALHVLRDPNQPTCEGYEARWGPERGRSFVLRAVDGMGCRIEARAATNGFTCAYGATVALEDLRTAPGRRGRWRGSWNVGQGHYELVGNGVTSLGETPLSVVDPAGRGTPCRSIEPPTTTAPAAEPPLFAIVDGAVQESGMPASRLVRVDRATLRHVAGQQARLGTNPVVVTYSPGDRRALVAEFDATRVVVRSVLLQPPMSERATILARGEGLAVSAAAWPKARRIVALVDPIGLRIAGQPHRDQRLVVADPLSGRVVASRVLAGTRRWIPIPVGTHRLLLGRNAGDGEPAEVVEVDEDGRLGRPIPVPGARSLDGFQAVAPDGRRVVIAPEDGPLVELDLSAATAATHPRPDVTVPSVGERTWGEPVNLAWIDADRLVLTGIERVTTAGDRRANRMGTWLLDVRTWEATPLPVPASFVRVVDGTILLSGYALDLVQQNGNRRRREGVGIVAMAPDGTIQWRRYEEDRNRSFLLEPAGSRMYVLNWPDQRTSGDVLETTTGRLLGTWVGDRPPTLLDPSGTPR